MVNKDKWIDNYSVLDSKDQLDVAEAIVGELKENEIFFDKNEYDMEKSMMIREFFRRLEYNLHQEKEIKENLTCLHNFEMLSDDNKNKAISEIFEIIKKYIDAQDKEEAIKTCGMNGHKFGNWVHNRWSTFEELVVGGQYIDDYVASHDNWERKCSLCGFIEKVDSKPQELIGAKKIRIKRKEQ